MLSRLKPAATTLVRARLMSSAARPMTRFVQYPFDKTKMEEVRAWANESDLPGKLRAQKGIKDVEFSFCECRSQTRPNPNLLFYPGMQMIFFASMSCRPWRGMAGR